jgi:hypothetical protein
VARPAQQGNLVDAFGLSRCVFQMLLIAVVGPLKGFAHARNAETEEYLLNLE